MAWRQPRSGLFVETEGWHKLGTARSRRATGDHFRYTLTLGDGTTLFTRVSHGPGEIADPKRVAAILRDQLQVNEAQFWDWVDDGVVPTRPTSDLPENPTELLDYRLVRNLVKKVGLNEAEVKTLTKEQAVARWHAFLAGGAHS